jgi:hypothetical protein
VDNLEIKGPVADGIFDEDSVSACPFAVMLSGVEASNRERPFPFDELRANGLWKRRFI